MGAIRAVYSIGVRFAGGGIGNIAYQDASALQRRDLLQRLLCGSYRRTDIPEALIRQMGWVSRIMRRLAIYEGSEKRITALHGRLYDRWARSRLEPCELFISWNGFGLQAQRRARELGAITMSYRASSHPHEQMRLLQEERARWKLPPNAGRADTAHSVAEMEEADYVIIPSDFVRETCLKHGVEAGKLLQIPFGVDGRRFHPADVPRQGQPFRVMFLGQIGFRKGVAYLVEAWQRLGWQDAELWLVGSVQAEFTAWLRPYRGLPGLRLPGHAGDPAQALRQADLFVFPSIEEGSALVVYEAMASGLAVITTPNAGAPIRHEQDGLLLPIRDVEGLAAAMEALRADPQWRERLGSAARRTIEAYTWARYQERFTRCITEKAAARA